MRTEYLQCVLAAQTPGPNNTASYYNTGNFLTCPEPINGELQRALSANALYHSVTRPGVATLLNVYLSICKCALEKGKVDPKRDCCFPLKLINLLLVLSHYFRTCVTIPAWHVRKFLVTWVRQCFSPDTPISSTT